MLHLTRLVLAAALGMMPSTSSRLDTIVVTDTTPVLLTEPTISRLISFIESLRKEPLLERKVVDSIDHKFPFGDLKLYHVSLDTVGGPPISFAYGIENMSKLANVPSIAAALHQAHLSPQQFEQIFVATGLAEFAATSGDQGFPIDTLSSSHRAQNIRFIHVHQNEIQKLSKLGLQVDYGYWTRASAVPDDGTLIWYPHYMNPNLIK